MRASPSDSQCCRVVPSGAERRHGRVPRGTPSRGPSELGGMRIGRSGGATARRPTAWRGDRQTPRRTSPTAELASDGHRAPRALSQPDRVVGERAGSLTEHPLGGSTWNVDVPVPPRARCPPTHDDSCRGRPSLVDRDRAAVRDETGAQRAVRTMGFGAHRPVARETGGGSHGGRRRIRGGSTWNDVVRTASDDRPGWFHVKRGRIRWCAREWRTGQFRRPPGLG